MPYKYSLSHWTGKTVWVTNKSSNAFCGTNPLHSRFLFCQASNNVDVLKDHEAVKQLGSILKTNVRACKALGMYNVI